MNRPLHHFTTELLHPDSEQVVAVEVAYRIEDVGVMGLPAEMLRPVIQSVVAADAMGVDLLPKLDADAIAQLERQASEFYRDEFLPDHHE